MGDVCSRRRDAEWIAPVVESRLPVGWEQLQVPGKDQHYYFNPMTNQRQWDDPRMLDGLNPQAVMSRAYQPFGLQPPDITRGPGNKETGGHVFLIGGTADGHVSKTVEVFNPKKDYERENYKGLDVGVTPLPHGVTASAAVAYKNHIYVFGGFDGWDVSDLVQIYNPKENKWTISETKMPTKRSGHGCVINGGCIYLIGGWDGEKSVLPIDRYTFSQFVRGKQISDYWEQTGQLSEPRSHGVAVALYGGCMWAIGGANERGKALGSVEKCDVRQPFEQWDTRNRMHFRRSSHTVSVLFDSMYAIGGWDDQKALGSVERYDAETDHWQLIQCMGNSSPQNEDSMPRAWVCSASVNSHMYVFGGHCQDRNREAELREELGEDFTPLESDEEEEEDEKPEVPDKQLHSSMQAFDPVHNHWTTMACTLKAAKSGMCAVVLDNAAYLMKGGA